MTPPATQPPATRRAHARQALLRGCALIVSVFLSVAFLEIALRLSPLFLPEPARSFVEEAARFHLSNVRMYPREVAIRLPSAKNADILIVGDSLPFGTYEASEDLYWDFHFRRPRMDPLHTRKPQRRRESFSSHNRPGSEAVTQPALTSWG